MSESWMQLITSVILGWGAWEIRALRGEFRRYVLRDDCHDDMQRHCSEIKKLNSELMESRDRITKLESKAAVWHKEE